MLFSINHKDLRHKDQRHSWLMEVFRENGVAFAG